MVVIAAVFIIFLAPRYGQKNVVIYVVICSTLGSLTVMGCKGVGVALKSTFHGRNEFTHFMTYVMLGIVAGCILFQVNYLNKALDTFNTAIVTPTYYVLFTSCVILVSLVLFKEFYNMSPQDIIGDLCGFLTIVLGIFMLNWFKDMNISLKNIPKATKKDTQDLYVNSKDGKHFLPIDHDNDSLLECNENSSLDDVHLLEYYDNPSYTDIPRYTNSEPQKKSVPNGVVPKEADNNNDEYGEDENTHLWNVLSYPYRTVIEIKTVIIHMIWVLVRIASVRQFYWIPTVYIFLEKWKGWYFMLRMKILIICINEDTYILCKNENTDILC